MTATIGATLSTVALIRYHRAGPFQSSAGNIYFFGRDTTNTGTVEPHKASNPMSSFAAQTAKLMSSATTTALECIDCYQVGDVIHIVTQIATGAVYYNSYDMATDAWTLVTSETAVAAATQAPVSGTTWVSLVVRSNGNVVIAHNAGQTAMSSTFNMCRYRIRTGTNTYGTATNFDNGGSINWVQPIAALGASDRVHFFLKDATNNDLFQRTLTSANVLQTWPSAFETSLSGDLFGMGNAISYVDGATTKVRMCYMPLSPLVGRVAMLDSADSPTVSVQSATDAQVLYSTKMEMALAADGTTLYLPYVDSSTTDLWLDTSTDGGSTWGTDTEEQDAVTLSRITANVYTRSGTKYLAMVINDGGAYKYAETTLTAPVTASLIWPTETPYRILSRR